MASTESRRRNPRAEVAVGFDDPNKQATRRNETVSSNVMAPRRETEERKPLRQSFVREGMHCVLIGNFELFVVYSWVVDPQAIDGTKTEKNLVLA